MPSPYLSRIKLEKELEKKAQILKEKREKCEKSLDNVEKYLEVLKSRGMDYENKGIEDARSKFQIKDFDPCIEKIEPVEKELEERVKKLFEDEINGIEKAIEKEDVDGAAKIRADLKQAREKFEEDVLGAFKFLDEIKSEISELMKGTMAKRKMELKDTISSIGGFEDLLSKLEKVDENDITSMEVLNSIEEEFRKRVRERIDEYLSKSKALVEMARKARYSITEDEEEINLINERYEAGDYPWAIKKAEEHYNKVKENFDLFFKKLMDISKMIINEGTAMEVDMNIPMDMIHKAEEMYKEGKYTEAVEQLKKATEEAEKEKLQKVLEVIKIAREKILEAKKRGIDIQPYLELIDNARNLIKVGRRKKAYENVMKVIQQIDRKLNLYNQLKKEVEGIESLLEELSEEGIILEGLDAKIEEIKNVLEKDPEKAEKMIDELNRIIHVNLRDVANTLHQDLAKLVESSIEVGIDLRDAKMEIENAESLMSDENYRDAILSLRETEDKIWQKLEDFFHAKIDELKDDEEVSDKLKELKGLVEEGDMEAAIEKYNEIRHILLSRQISEYSSKLSDIEERVSILEDMGENTVEVRGYMDRARRAIQENDLNLLEGYISQITEIVEKMFRERAIKSYESAREIVEAAEKSGINIEKTGLKSLLEKAKESFDAKKFAEAIKYAEEGRKKAKEIKERADNVQILKNQLENIVKRIQESGADASKFSEILSSSISLIKMGEFEEAEKKLKGAIERAQMEEIQAKLDEIRRVWMQWEASSGQTE